MQLISLIITVLVLTPINIGGRYLFNQMETEFAKFNAGYWTGFFSFCAAMIVNAILL